MITCNSGRTIVKPKKDIATYVLRLNLIDRDAMGNTKYRTKDISTGLEANKRNKIKANALLEEMISNYNHIGETSLFSDYCLQWLEKKKIEVETITYEGYQYRISHIVNYFESNPVTISELSAGQVDNFYHYLLTKDKLCSTPKTSKSLSNRTIKDIAILLRAILKDAIVLGDVPDREKTLNAIKLKVPKRPEESAEQVYIGIDEADIFRNAIRGHRLELPFLLAFYYGLRREEILGLKWSAIRDNHLYIEHTVTRMKTTVAKNRTKTSASHRNYPIPDEIKAMLDKIYEKQQLNQNLFGNAYHHSDYIFTWENGRTYSPDYLTKSFKKLVMANEKLDNRLTLHSLRASCVSILVHEGIDIKDIQTWVGHKDIQTTLNIYARTNQKQQTKVMKCMSNTLFT